MTRKRINEQSTTRARSLRGNMTDAERKLWQAIREKQICDQRFRRQHPIGTYIVDFACIDRKLVIELDGGQHQEQRVYDEHRTDYLQKQGWRVLRFWNNEVMENLEGVLESIAAHLSLHPHPNLPPSRGKE